MILQSKLKCDNYPALIEKGTHREINDPHPRKEVQLHSNLSAVNLLPYVLSNRGLFAPVCLSKEQLVSWPLEAVKASSFHWNRWHAGAENHSAIFIPRASKSTLRYHSSPILSEITVLRHCTSLMIHLPFAGCVEDCFGSVSGRKILSSKNEYRSQSLEAWLRWQWVSSKGKRDSPASFWKWPDLSTEEEPCSARATW